MSTPILETDYAYIWKSSDYVATKMMQLIPAGGMSVGWFWSVFRGIRRDELKEDKVTVIVLFSDAITGKRHYLREPLKLGSYIPGLSAPIKEPE
jgi:hypothetical protein